MPANVIPRPVRYSSAVKRSSAPRTAGFPCAASRAGTETDRATSSENERNFIRLPWIAWNGASKELIVTRFSPNSMRPAPRSEQIPLRYTRLVIELFFVLLALFTPQTSKSQAAAQTSPSPASFQTGVVLDQVVAANHPGQSYALYLPSNYSPDHSWPIVFSFDPSAYGKAPVELQKEAAEQLGYILAASNNSRNGPHGPQIEAANAMVQDVASRFPIDERRIYFAGFSGGARVAAMLAVSCQCTAGVLLNGAGFLSGTEPPRGSTFAVFSAVGDFDFNYAELIPLQDKLSQAGYPHWLRVFDGRHQWAPPEVMQEALAWFAVQAQKSHIAPRVGAFLNAQFAKEVARAGSLEQAGDLFNAWRQNVQVAATFDGLEDVAAVRAKVDSLEKEKSVREGAKRERGEFDEQGRLTSAISDGLYSPMESSTTISEHTRTLVDQVRQLRSYTETEKRPERLRIYRRALGSVFVESLESGWHFLETKDYPSAIRSFRCATEAVPEFEGAWRNLAVAYSLADRKKETLATLRRARDLGQGPAAFAEWLKLEPAFDPYRSSSELQDLLNGK